MVGTDIMRAYPGIEITGNSYFQAFVVQLMISKYIEFCSDPQNNSLVCAIYYL